jgi:glycosyltransferase involved in cell wall biosynthesis
LTHELFRMEGKLKVVWICHFTNADIQKQLKPRKKISEFAPWITLGIKEVKKRSSDIELHIISPHRWINGIKEFQEENVFYHFFNPGIPWYGRHWPYFFRLDSFTGFRFNRMRIKKIAKSVNPDIIHWHGAENGYFTSSFFDLYNQYPHLVTIQGFISLALNNDNNGITRVTRANKKAVAIEKKILATAKNFGVRDHFMKNEILKYNSAPNFFWHEYFINIPESINDVIKSGEKQYDIIYFSRLAKSKGIEDLIISVGIIKKSLPDIKLAIIGSSDATYLDFLKNLALNNDCLDNIDFKGFIPKQDEIYHILSRSKVFVLPAYVGDVPGGMIESMVRKIPVVTYKSQGIAEVNLNSNNIELVEQGNIDGLASRITYLLMNPSYAEELAERAYMYATSRWNNRKALNDILIAYKSILKK